MKPECAEAIEELDAYLDGELPPDRLAELSQHLADCYPCADHVVLLEQLKALVRRGCRESAPPDLVARLRVRLEG